MQGHILDRLTARAGVIEECPQTLSEASFWWGVDLGSSPGGVTHTALSLSSLLDKVGGAAALSRVNGRGYTALGSKIQNGVKGWLVLLSGPRSCEDGPGQRGPGWN